MTFDDLTPGCFLTCQEDSVYIKLTKIGKYMTLHKFYTPLKSSTLGMSGETVIRDTWKRKGFIPKEFLVNDEQE